MGTLNPGDSFADRFSVQHAIGEGGMAEVYEAVDRQTGTRVALKVLRPSFLSANPSEADRNRRRFRREAAILEALHESPHVVNLICEGDAAGLAYIALEYLDGRVLREMIATDRGLEPKELFFPIATQLLVGLQHIHAQEVVHRDVAADNVFVQSDPEFPHGIRVVYIDFGIGKDQTDVTGRFNILMGKLPYLAPERVTPVHSRGESKSPASDVYSLGSLLYRMASGRWPIEGLMSVAHLVRIQTESPVDLNEHPQTQVLPEEVRRAIMAMLAKRPDERPRLEELQALFHAYEGGILGGAVPALGDAPRPLPPEEVAEGPKTSDLTNQVIEGHIRLKQLVGRGAMGAVYRGTNDKLQIEVAVKVASQSAANIFEEARKLAHVTHPNVVRVWSVGRHANHSYLVMDFIPGSTLEELVQSEGPLSGGRFWELASKICDGVAYVHGLREPVIHNDLKPSNILVHAHGSEPKIADFGISRRLPGSDGKKSQTGQLWAGYGTVDYASPEVLNEQPPDQLSDLYALAGVLYFMLTGSEPFPAETGFQTMVRKSQGPPEPPSRRGAKSSRALDAVIVRAMDPEPSRRPPSVLDLRQELAEAMGMGARAARNAWPLLRVAAIAVLLAVLAGGAYAWQAYHRDTAAPTVKSLALGIEEDEHRRRDGEGFEVHWVRTDDLQLTFEAGGEREESWVVELRALHEETLEPREDVPLVRLAEKGAKTRVLVIPLKLVSGEIELRAFDILVRRTYDDATLWSESLNARCRASAARYRFLVDDVPPQVWVKVGGKRRQVSRDSQIEVVNPRSLEVEFEDVGVGFEEGRRRPAREGEFSVEEGALVVSPTCVDALRNPIGAGFRVPLRRVAVSLDAELAAREGKRVELRVASEAEETLEQIGRLTATLRFQSGDRQQEAPFALNRERGAFSLTVEVPEDFQGAEGEVSLVGLSSSVPGVELEGVAAPLAFDYAPPRIKNLSVAGQTVYDGQRVLVDRVLFTDRRSLGVVLEGEEGKVALEITAGPDRTRTYEIYEGSGEVMLELGEEPRGVFGVRVADESGNATERIEIPWTVPAGGIEYRFTGEHLAGVEGGESVAVVAARRASVEVARLENGEYPVARLPDGSTVTAGGGRDGDAWRPIQLDLPADRRELVVQLTAPDAQRDRSFTLRLDEEPPTFAWTQGPPRTFDAKDQLEVRFAWRATDDRHLLALSAQLARKEADGPLQDLGDPSLNVKPASFQRVATNSFSLARRLSPGRYTMVGRARDAFGREAEARYDFEVVRSEITAVSLQGAGGEPRPLGEEMVHVPSDALDLEVRYGGLRPEVRIVSSAGGDPSVLEPAPDSQEGQVRFSLKGQLPQGEHTVEVLVRGVVTRRHRLYCDQHRPTLTIRRVGEEGVLYGRGQADRKEVVCLVGSLAEIEVIVEDDAKLSREGSTMPKACDRRDGVWGSSRVVLRADTTTAQERFAKTGSLVLDPDTIIVADEAGNVNLPSPRLVFVQSAQLARSAEGDFWQGGRLGLPEGREGLYGRYEVRWRGRTLAPAEDGTLPELEEGRGTLEVRLQGEGGASWTVLEETLVVDREPPTVTPSEGRTITVRASGQSYRLQARDAVSGVAAEGASWQVAGKAKFLPQPRRERNGRWSWDVRLPRPESLPEDGAEAVFALADRAGNRREVRYTLKPVKVAPTPPQPRPEPVKPEPKPEPKPSGLSAMARKLREAGPPDGEWVSITLPDRRRIEMMRYEVTNAQMNQMKAFWQGNRAEADRAVSQALRALPEDYPRYVSMSPLAVNLGRWTDRGDASNKPVVRVPRNLAISYAAAIGGRLPRAEEWHYAYRGSAAHFQEARRPGFKLLRHLNNSIVRDLRIIPVTAGARGGFGVQGISDNANEWVLAAGSPRRRYAEAGGPQGTAKEFLGFRVVRDVE